MKIELFKNSLFELEINSSTPNDGIYFWSIPDGLENSTQYQIKITDVSNSSIYDYSDPFEIYDTPTLSDQDDIPGYDLLILFFASIVIIIGVIVLLSKKKTEIV